MSSIKSLHSLKSNEEGKPYLPITMAGKIQYVLELIKVLIEPEPRNAIEKIWFFVRHRKSWKKYNENALKKIIEQ